jgi:hypothetical protein
VVDYLVREEDGTSKFTLEDSSGSLLLETSPADTISVGFIASGTSLFALTLSPGPVDLALGFISAGTSLFAPILAGSLDAPFISSSTTVFAPTLSAAGAAPLALPFIAASTNLYALVIAPPVFDWEGISIGIGQTFMTPFIIWTRIDN